MGTGILYSINYDRLFKDNIGSRIGFMYLSELDFGFASADDLLLVPVTFNFFVGGKYKVEFSAGVVIASVSNTGAFGFKSDSGGSNIIVRSANVGYHYQKHDSGFLFRAGFTALFCSGDFEQWGDINIKFSY